METLSQHDVVIIGAGPAGDRAATLAVREGLDVAQVEREKVGGECAYWACMPSKALLRPGELLAEIRRVPGVPGGELDASAILARRDEVIHGGDDSSHAQRQTDRGITLYRGVGRLTGERRVSVTRTDGTVHALEARRAVILAVGSGADLPPIPGLADAAPWTNRDATTATRVPSSLIVLGGGPVGCELAQAWHSLGAEVTLVEATSTLLTGAEPFATELMRRSLSEQGIDIRLNTRAEQVARDEDRFVLGLDSGEELNAEELLVCIGRRPMTDDLGLASVDLADGELVPVDDHLRVPRHGDWLYAIGDVNGRALLTQAGRYQAAVAVANIMNREARATWDGDLTPQVIFTEPQVASVGHTLAAALAAGLPARAIDADPGDTPGASFVGHGGFSGARIVVDEQREVILGATFVGPEVAEWLPAPTFAIVGHVSLRTLAHAMPAYPTRADVWLELLADWGP